MGSGGNEDSRGEDPSPPLSAAQLRSQRLEALGSVAGNVAHDFNNLLMSIQGSVELAQLHLDEGHPSREQLAFADEVIRQAGELSKQLLAFARGGPHEDETCDLSTVVAHSAPLLQCAASGRCKIEFALDRDLPGLDVDPGKLRHTLLNLVCNAAEALPESGGHIRVATGSFELRHEHLAGAALPADARPGPHVYLEVADDGPGRPAAEAAQLLSAGRTSKAERRGLGLTAIRDFVQQSGGCLLVHDSPEGLTRFRIALPAARPAPASSADPSPDEGWRGEGLAIVVDDEAGVRRIAAALLRVLGFEVLEADGGKMALRLLSEHRERVRLMLVDLAMPGVDGGATLGAVRELEPALPIVVMSGYPPASKDADMLGHHAAEFLMKPFRLNSIRDAAQAATERAESRRR